MTEHHGGWRKSSYSGNGPNCVEVRTAPEHTSVRDTKNRAGAVLDFSPAAWSTFVQTHHRA